MSKAKQSEIKDVASSVESAPVIDPREKIKQKIEAQRIKENKLVRGKFIFHEVPGGSMTFPFRKFPGDPIRKYTFVDGEIYKIPLSVAKHLNENGSYQVHAYKSDKNGKPAVGVGKTIDRFSFHSLDFIDTSDANSLATMGRSPLVSP
jgi:hypothetical protein